MLSQIRELGERIVHRQEEPEEHDHGGFTTLRLLAAQLLLVSGADSTLEQLSRSRAAEPGEAPPRGLVWAPAILAPLAAAAHVAHAMDRSESTTLATRVLDAAVLGIGVAHLAESLLSARSRAGAPSLTPLLLASAGLFGFALDRQERATQEEARRLARRAAVVERLVPRRRPKLDHVVVHV